MPFTGGMNQTFKLEKAYTNNRYMGYYKIIPAEAENKVIAVPGSAYADDLVLYIEQMSTVDKRQEFLFSEVTDLTTTSDECYLFTITTRCTGGSKAIARSNATTPNIIQSTYDPTNLEEKHLWRILKVNSPWDGYYGQSGGSKTPNNFKVHVETNNYFSLSNVQLCLNRWNNLYSSLNLTAVSSENPYATDYLANIKINTSTEVDFYGETKGKKISNGVIEGTSVDQDWHSTEITLCIGYMLEKGLTGSQRLKVLTHEIGHALKLSHTYSAFIKSSSSRVWSEKSRFKTTMDQGETSPGEPTALDEFRLKEKWDAA